MKKRMKVVAVTTALILASAGIANATPAQAPQVESRGTSTTEARENALRAYSISREKKRVAQAKRKLAAKRAAHARWHAREDARRKAAADRSSRSTSQRVNVPERTSGQRITGTREITGWKAEYWAKGQVWATWAKTRAVIACESSNDPQKVSRTGKYRGLYQFDAQTWASYGGLEVASRPDLATRAEQNYVGFRLYSGRGWGPWECA